MVGGLGGLLRTVAGGMELALLRSPTNLDDRVVNLFSPCLFDSHVSHSAETMRTMLVSFRKALSRRSCTAMSRSRSA